MHEDRGVPPPPQLSRNKVPLSPYINAQKGYLRCGVSSRLGCALEARVSMVHWSDMLAIGSATNAAPGDGGLSLAALGLGKGDCGSSFATSAVASIQKFGSPWCTAACSGRAAMTSGPQLPTGSIGSGDDVMTSGSRKKSKTGHSSRSGPSGGRGSDKGTTG